MILREMLIGDLSRLADVQRYSNTRVLKHENVPTHTFYTSIYTLLLCRWCRRYAGLSGIATPPINEGRALANAVLHDVEEARTGDINRLFKHANPVLEQEIALAAQKEMTTLLEGLYGGPSVDGEEIFASWASAKDDSFEGRIVAFADFLSVLSYLWQEVRCSNNTMLAYQVELVNYSEGFSDPSFAFLQPLVSEAQAMTRRLMSALRQSVQAWEGEIDA